MKKILYILVFIFSFSGVSLAQSPENSGERLREKMVEYIETKLALTKPESEKFEPIFNDYLRQMRATRQEYKSDKILLQQKMAELRVRTRDQLKPVIGEARSNEVFKHEHDFVEKAKAELKDRIEERRANKKTGLLL
jgi:hypothetical protein